MSAAFSTQYRKRISRLLGKTWLLMLFVFLTWMNFATGQIIPLIGSLAPLCCGSLIVVNVWTGILLAAIWRQQGWARFVLAIFLMCFVLGQGLIIPEALVRYPQLQGNGLRLLLLLSSSYAFSAIFLLWSLDIRQLAHQQMTPPAAE